MALDLRKEAERITTPQASFSTTATAYDREILNYAITVALVRFWNDAPENALTEIYKSQDKEGWACPCSKAVAALKRKEDGK